MKQYTKYKNSEVNWIDEIPEHWQIKKLKYFAQIVNGQDQKEVVSEEGEYPILGTGGVFGRSKKFLYDKPSVLLGRKGTINNPFYIEEPFWTVDTLFYTRIFKNVFPKYFFYSCRCIDFSMYKTGSAVPSMTQETLLNIQRVYPPYNEQIEIASFLDHKTAEIDELIAAKEELITKLEAQRKAIINESVTGQAYKTGLIPSPDGKPVKFKDSGIDWLGEIPEHWEVKKLKYCAKKITTGKTPSTDNDDYFRDGAIKWYSPGDFKSLVLEDSNRKITKKAVSDLNIELYPPKTVLFVGIGATLGKVAITNDYCYSNQQINAIQFNNSMLPEYGLLYFEAFKDIIANYANSATLAILNQTQTKNLLFLQPNIREQQNVIDYLKEKLYIISELQVEARKSITKLNNFKQSLISEAVTGKIDIDSVKKNRY